MYIFILFIDLLLTIKNIGQDSIIYLINISNNTHKLALVLLRRRNHRPEDKNAIQYQLVALLTRRLLKTIFYYRQDLAQVSICDELL